MTSSALLLSLPRSSGIVDRQEEFEHVSIDHTSIAELSQKVSSRPLPLRPHSAADFRRKRYCAPSQRSLSPTAQQINEETTAESEDGVRPCSVPSGMLAPHPPSEPCRSREHLPRRRPMTARPAVRQSHQTNYANYS